MDQQRYDYLSQQRGIPGALTYEQAQAYDAADSRHEFDQFKQGAAGAAPPDQPQSNIAVQGPIGGGQPAPQGDVVLPAGQVPPPTPDQPTTTPNPLIPTQNNPYPQAKPHDFWNDLGLPQDPRYIGPHPVAARLLNLMDRDPSGVGGYAAKARTLGGMAFNALPAAAAQIPTDPQTQDMVYSGVRGAEGLGAAALASTPFLVPAMLARRLLGRMIGK